MLVTIRRRRNTVLVVLCSLVGLLACGLAVPVAAAPLPTNCPDRVHTPKAVDSSEVPAPGSTVPAPPPVPAKPVGGEQLAGCGYVLPKGAPPLPAKLRFQSWVIFDVNSGDVLAARDPHARLRPASLAKMLLALTVARELEPGTVVIGTQADANAEGTRVGIGRGGKYTVDQLLHGLLMHSGNDIAHALAMRLGGMPQALRKENALAHSLGALDTQVESPSGLDAPGMSTSAYDLSVIFDQVLHNPYLTSLIHTRSYPFPGFGGKPGFLVINDNQLLANYPGDIGGKTGFTDDATHTYANAAERDGHKIGLIMMHNDNHLEGMYQNGLALMNYGFALAKARSPAVGRLVSANPDKAAVAVTPTAVAAAGTAGSEGHSFSGLMTALVLVALVLIALALGLWLYRRRSTRS